MTITVATHLVRVDVSEDGDFLSVHPIWANVDRPDTGGWGLGKTPAHRKLAKRLVAAIEAGAAIGTPEVLVDNAGKTYVSVEHKVLGRHLNADLKRLGF